MIPDVISIGGAAFRSSFVRSFATKKEWIDDRMKTTGSAWPDKTADVRKSLFGQVWDIANPKRDPGK